MSMIQEEQDYGAEGWKEVLKFIQTTDLWKFKTRHAEKSDELHLNMWEDGYLLSKEDAECYEYEKKKGCKMTTMKKEDNKLIFRLIKGLVHVKAVAKDVEEVMPLETAIQLLSGENQKVSVRLMSGKVIELQCNQNDTVAYVKQMLQESEGLNVKFQKMLLNTVEVQNSAVLKDLDIDDDTELSLVVSEPVYRIVVKHDPNFDSNYTVVVETEVKFSDTVADLRSKIAEIIGKQVHHVGFNYDDEIIDKSDDALTMGELKMVDGGEILVVCELEETDSEEPSEEEQEEEDSD